METTKKKKSRWIKAGNFATYEMPSGIEKQFDFSKLSNEVFAYYGKKQWLADQGASEKDTPDDDRLKLMVDAFNEAVEKGVALSDEGRVQIIGKERSNAAANTQKADMKDMVKIQKRVFSGEATDEEVAWLKTMLDKYDK